MERHDRTRVDGPPSGAPIEQLVPKYHRARTLVACTAALILLWWLGVKFEGPLPLLGVHVKELDKHAYILGVILFYAVVRLLIEWFQSDPWRRRRYASRIDLGLTLVVASGAGWLLADKLLPILPLPSLPSLSFFVSAITLVGLGIAAGEFVKVLLFSLYFIRSSEEARRLGLPRVPVAVRATFRAVWVILPALIVALLLASSFAPPMSHLWPWFLGLPFLVIAGAQILSMVPRVHRRPDGTQEPRRVWIERLRKVFDQHDAVYQVSGWDRQAPDTPSPLFVAAKRGDTEVVKQMLAKGANPDELNIHGWTALMIAVAEGHLKTAMVLLSSGANPNIKNIIGRTPLMFAARYGYVDLVRILLEHEADPDINSPQSPGALCVAASEGHLDVVQLLLEMGADPRTKDYRGFSAQQYAEESGRGEVAAALRLACLDRERRPCD